MLCRIMPCSIVVSYLVVSYHAMLCRTLCSVMPCRAMSYYFVSCRTITCRTMSQCVMSCRAMYHVVSTIIYLICCAFIHEHCIIKGVHEMRLSEAETYSVQTTYIDMCLLLGQPTFRKTSENQFSGRKRVKFITGDWGIHFSPA